MEISFDDFKRLKDIEIIDLRDSDKYLKKHLKGSINVAFNALIVYPERYLKKNKKYLLICDLGLKSKKTSEILNNNGYYTYSLMGGFKNIIM